MALGSAGLSGTGGALDNYVPIIWSKRAQLAFEKNCVAKRYSLDLSDLLSAQGGDNLQVPKLANRTATTRTLTTLSQVTPAGATEDVFSMDVQTWVIDPESISFAVKAQTKLFLLSNLEHKMTESVMRKFDTSLLANYSSFSNTAQGTDDGATPASPDDIFTAAQLLDTASTPREGRVIILGPKTYWRFIKNNTITSQDFTSGHGKETGLLPKLAGMEVHMSQNIPTTASGSEVNLVMHKEALAFAIAQPIKIEMEHSVSWLQDVYVSNMVYGTGCYRATAGCAVYGS